MSNRDRSVTVVFLAQETAHAGMSAALALAAFNGAVIGFAGSVVGLITGDPEFAAVSALGATICGGIWYRQLTDE